MVQKAGIVITLTLRTLATLGSIVGATMTVMHMLGCFALATTLAIPVPVIPLAP